MKLIQEYIVGKQVQFENHPFFRHLEQATSIDTLKHAAPQLTFWVMVFQDILRINEMQIKDPYLHKIARHHRIEDSNHEQWFIADIQRLHGSNKYDIGWLFGKSNVTTRDAAYSLITETMTQDNEYLRILILLTLESSGHVFFERTAEYVEKMGYESQLQYFSSKHLAVEKAHALFEEEMERKLFEYQFSPDERYQAISLVERMYQAFFKMFDGVMEHLNTIEQSISDEQSA